MRATAGFVRHVMALRDDRGVSAVEFALIAPVLLTVFMLAIDLGVAFNAKLRLLSALAAGAQYVQKNGTALTASTFSDFKTAVTTVVTSVADLPIDPTVTVAINGTTDGSAAGSYFCVSGSSPTWTRAASSSTACAADLSAGQFVTLSISVSLTTVFPTDPLVGSIFPLAETIIVRVK